MYIEDIIHQIAVKSIALNRYDKTIVLSFTQQIQKSIPFTEKQCQLSIKICKRYLSKINLALNSDISLFLENPTFKFGIRQLVVSKKMFITENSDKEKVIGLEFPYNDDLIKKIRESRDNLLHAAWEPDKKIWIFSLDERSLVFLNDVRKTFNFDVDSELEIFFETIQNIYDNIENYVPMLIFDGKELQFKNTPFTLPDNLKNHVPDSVFYARKCGVVTWDEEINKILYESEGNNGIIDFLNSDPGQKFHWNRENYEEKTAFEVLKYLYPALFIIPVDQELPLCGKILENLNNVGIENEEISIMFRLSSETGSQFNEFVKNNKLNNPIDENTKVIFVSGKIPKTVISKNLKFHCIFNYNIYNVHYTVQEFLKNHENVINFHLKSQQQDILW